MDEPVPVIDFSPSGSTDSDYSLERVDVDGMLIVFSLVVLYCLQVSFLVMMNVLGDLEQYAKSVNDDIALKAVNECRASLNKLIGKMDGLEMNFDRMAERSRGSIHFREKFDGC
jgi:autophagy-related protein 11